MQTLTVILTYVGILLWVLGLFLAFFSHLRGFLGRGLAIIWQKKYLWLLGFFAGMTAYGGEVNFLFRKLNTVASLQALLQGIRTSITNGQVDRLVHASKNLWESSAGRVLLYIFIILAIIALFAWLIIMSQAALVRIVGRTQEGKPTGLLDGLTVGTEKFWVLVQLNIIGLLLGWAMWVILAGVPAAIYLVNSMPVWSVVAYIGSILSIVVSASIIFLIQFSTAGIVLNDSRLIPAIIDAFRLFVRNIVSSVEMAIAIFTVNLTLSFLVLGELFFFMNVFTVGGLLGVIGIITLIYTLLSTFSIASWTVYYLKLVDGKSPSKLAQWTNQLVNFAGQKRISE